MSLRPESPPTEAPGAGALFPSITHVAGYGEARNLHLLVEDRLTPINRWLRDRGGLNRHNEPNYRIVWGWQNPQEYGLSGGKYLEFFHFEWWRPVEMDVTENEWAAEQAEMRRETGGLYIPRPYPRHGEYKWITTCEFGIGRPGHMVAAFRWPDSPMVSPEHRGVLWYEFQLFDHLRRRARSRAAIEEAVERTQALEREAQRAATNSVQDEFGIRELVEEAVSTLHRNPTLRQEPGFMLSPAVAYKKARHWPTASNG